MAVSRYHLAAGVLGFTLGLSLSSLLSSTTTSISLAHLQHRLEQYQLPPTPLSTLHRHLQGETGPTTPVVFHDDPTVHLEEEEQAQGLTKGVRVLCWIMTGPANHKTKAAHVKATWGRRCNTLLFMSSQEDAELGSIGLGVPEGHDNLWAKTREAFRYPAAG